MTNSQSTTPKLAVVIPFCNEQDNVCALLAEVHQALAATDSYEIIAVDDGSSDNTVHVLSMADAPYLRIVTLAVNCGQSAAIAHGVQAARAPLVVTLDGDGQNPPAEIPALLQAYRQTSRCSGAPLLVIGWRQDRNDTWLRRISSRLANRLRGALLGDGCPDTGCGLKVFARADFLRLPRFAHMHRFLPALFIRDGGRVHSVPVSHRPRRSGKSKYGIRNRLWVGFVDMAGVCWLQRRGCTLATERDDV